MLLHVPLSDNLRSPSQQFECQLGESFFERGLILYNGIIRHTNIIFMIECSRPILLLVYVKISLFCFSEAAAYADDENEVDSLLHVLLPFK